MPGGDPKYKNITLDKEAGEFLMSLQKELGTQLGFEPSASQCLKYLKHKLEQLEAKAPQ